MSASRSRGTTGTAGADARGLAVAVAAGLVPWIVLPYPGGVAFVTSYGLVSLDPVHVESVVRYVFVHTGPLPPSLFAWPVATLLYALGLASSALALVGRADWRVTAGLYALAGLDVLYFAVSFPAGGPGLVALPVGTVMLWAAAWVARPPGWPV